MPAKKIYAVVKGRKPGLYIRWEGPDGAQEQVGGFAGAVFKGFSTMSEARLWYAAQGGPPLPGILVAEPLADSHHTDLKAGKTIIYTDGGCLVNPGPGGYGVVMLSGNHRRELSGGFRLTTNNRMELYACITALAALKKAPTEVLLHSDSSYVVNGITHGWAKNWRARGWKKTNSQRVPNADLWARLLELCDQHTITFVWVRGHAGTPENERCDQLASAALRRRDLPVDEAFERVGKDQPGLFE